MDETITGEQSRTSASSSLAEDLAFVNERGFGADPIPQTTNEVPSEITQNSSTGAAAAPKPATRGRPRKAKTAMESNKSKLTPKNGIAKKTPSKKAPSKVKPEPAAHALALAAAPHVAHNTPNNTNNTNSSTGSSSTFRDRPPPPPQPARDVFPLLPATANPIDEAIFAALASAWDDEAGGWTPEMRDSFLETLPLARVTRTTAVITNHNISRRLRDGGGRGRAAWGQFMALRVMFGPAACFRQPWAADLGRRYPLALEDAWEGVVPGNPAAILDGVAGMPARGLRRMCSVRELDGEKRRRSRRGGGSAGKSGGESAGGGGGGASGSGGVSGSGGLLFGISGTGLEMDNAPKQEDTVEIDESAWREARDAAAAGMSPEDVVARLEERYKKQERQIKTLRESNEEIRRSVVQYTKMLAMASGS